jgi:prepilin-type N-terminal cleavage/methylation domain-containing protein
MYDFGMLGAGQDGAEDPTTKGNSIESTIAMKRHVNNVDASKKGSDPICAQLTPFSPRGFTLVEMLVVIAIVGILAGLITAGAMVALRRAKIAAIAVELSQLDAACKAYKEKFGDYPPDFAGLDNSNNDPSTGAAYNVGVQNLILAHISKAFPRYQPGVPSGNTATSLTQWQKLGFDVQAGWNIDINALSPASALLFFLGGQPVWRLDASNNPISPTISGFNASSPVTGLAGFCADPANPFAPANTPAGSSRIKPFYDFDIASIGWITNGPNAGLAYWPKVQAVVNKTVGPVVYFRAENANYTLNGAVPTTGATGATTNIKSQSYGVWPASDTGLSNYTAATPSIVWINPQSFQIFASGLDLQYGNLLDVGTAFYGLKYPAGTNYAPQTLDDITNFSGGALESKMP